MDDYAGLNEAWSSFFTKDPPARAAFGANGLALGAAAEVSSPAAARHRAFALLYTCPTIPSNEPAANEHACLPSPPADQVPGNDVRREPASFDFTVSLKG